MVLTSTQDMDSVNVNTNSLLPLLWASKLGARPNTGISGPFSWPINEFPSSQFKLLGNEQNNAILNGKLSLYSENDENKFSYLQRITPSGKR